MSELGETGDATLLVPGRPELLHEVAWSLGGRADELTEAGRGLARIAAPEGWSGPAADRFRRAFTVQPERWAEAGDAHRSAADAIEAYAATLEGAQRDAADAVGLWDDAQRRSATARAAYDQQAATTLAPPASFVDPADADRQAAVASLAAARERVREAGDRAAAAVSAAGDQAPQSGGFWSDLASGAGTVAAQVGNAAASIGNAALHHPGAVTALAGGAALTAVSAVGFAGGVALDATGVGTVGGLPLGAASAAGVATGVGLAGAGAIDLALNARTNDQVAPFRVAQDSGPSDGSTAPDPPFDPPTRITGMTQHGDAQAAGRDGGVGVSDEAMADAVANPTGPPQYRPNGTYRYTGKDAVVSLNEKGEVVTTWPTRSRGWRNR